MSLILIVEDNDKNLKLVRDVLQVKGYATIEAGTAEDGIVLARERKPDLILMDIQLPGMNGDAARPQQDHRGRLQRLRGQTDQPERVPGHGAQAAGSPIKVRCPR